MSKNYTISIGFKIEDQGNGLKSLVVDADGLTKALRGTVSEVTGLKKSWINFATMSRAWDGIKTAVSDLQSVCGELTDVYAVQVETETKATIRGGPLNSYPEEVIIHPKVWGRRSTSSD